MSPRGSTRATRHSLPGADDLGLAADGYGDPKRRPVVLLHGGGQTRHAWGGTAEKLAERGWYAVTVDARGHGESDWDEERRYLPPDFVRDVISLVAHYPTPPAIVGASLGGMSGLVAAGLHDVELPSLVLVDIAPNIEKKGVERIFAFMTAHPEGFGSLEEASDAVAGYQPHRKRPKDLSGLAKNLRRGDDGRFRWHWDPAFVEVMFERDTPQGPNPMERAAERLTTPTLLVRGKLSDLLSEAGAKRFLELAPHAEYVDITGAAHMVAGDANDHFTDAVAEFLGRTYPA